MGGERGGVMINGVFREELSKKVVFEKNPKKET